MSQLRLSLINGFELRCDGRELVVPLSSQRLIAYLALRDRALLRIHVAGTLWMDSTEERSCANLRSVLWRLKGPAANAVRANASHAWLSPEVTVDLRDVVACARRLLRQPDDAAASDQFDSRLLDGDLLPDWYDDWLLVERERLRQLRLHALETLAARATSHGRFGYAIDTALTAIQADPLRESAHRILIRAYIAEGNPCAAMGQFRDYSARIGRELGMAPSLQLREMISGLR